MEVRTGVIHHARTKPRRPFPYPHQFLTLHYHAPRQGTGFHIVRSMMMNLTTKNNNVILSAAREVCILARAARGQHTPQRDDGDSGVTRGPRSSEDTRKRLRPIIRGMISKDLVAYRERPSLRSK